MKDIAGIVTNCQYGVKSSYLIGYLMLRQVYRQGLVHKCRAHIISDYYCKIFNILQHIHFFP